MKKSIIVISCILLLLVTVGTTLALVFTNTDPVQNTFKPSKVSCAVVETLVKDDSSTTSETSGDNVYEVDVKKDVMIKNTGDTDAYIRVAIVVTWQKADGTVYAVQPELGKDYSMTLNLTDSGWFKKGDYYYYNQPVVPNADTPYLINSAAQLATAKVPDGYFLSIEIVASAIQSAPDDVVTSQWKVECSDVIIK